MTAGIRPVLKYAGAKWRLADWIISHLPPHHIYLEPFFGSGAVFFRKPPSRIETVNDVHHQVVNLFRILRERPGDLAAAIEITPWAREEFERACLPPTGDELEDARRFLVRCWQGIGGSDRYQQGWRRRVKKGGDGAVTVQWRALPVRMIEAVERLRDAQIECRPAVDVILQHNSPDVLIYADPPYVRESRTGRALDGKVRYRHRYVHEMTDDEHEELLDALDAHQGPALLSGYAHPLYDARLAHWKRTTCSSITEGAHVREEVLWINPVAAEALDGRLF